MDKTLINLFRDMIPVIAGVLIALFIENWKEANDDRRFVSRVYANIQKEMEENKEEIEGVLQLQKADLDTLRAYVDDERFSILQIMEKAEGLQMPYIKNTSWHVFLSAKIELIDYDDFSFFSELDEAVKFFDLKTEKLMDIALNSMNSTSKDEKVRVISQIEDVINSEQALLQAYHDYLEEKGKGNKER